MAAPTAQKVADYLGQGSDSDVLALAGEHLPVVTEMVRSYTRGNGFVTAAEAGDNPDLVEGEPHKDVAKVIVSATARSAVNPHSQRDVSIGDYSERRTVFQGFTLAEQAVLHRHRKLAA